MLLVLLMPLFLALMSVSVVNVALPAIEAGLQASTADLQWVLAGYTLTFGVVLVAAGRAGDLWGRKPLFVVGIAVYVLGSLISGLAADPVILNLSRLLTGVGAGLFNPQIIGVIQTLFTGRARGKAYGLFGTVIGLGVAVGPVMGGLLMGALGPEWGWRATFLVNVPVGVAAIILAVRWLRPPTRTTADQVPGGLRYLDPVGVILLAAATVALMVPFMIPGMLWSLGVAAGVLVLWWAWELRVRARAAQTGVYPMVDPRLFSRASFSFGTVQMTLYMSAMPAAFAVITLFTQEGLGYSALVAGLVTLPSALVVTASSTWVGSQVHRCGPWFVFAGGGLSVLTGLGLWWAFPRIASGEVAFWVLPALLVFQGATQALVLTSAQVIMMDDIRPHEAGSASGVGQTIQRVGTSIGMTAVTGVYFAGLAVGGGGGLAGGGDEVAGGAGLGGDAGVASADGGDDAVASASGGLPVGPELFGDAAASAMLVVTIIWTGVFLAAAVDLWRRRRARRLPA